MIQSYKSKVEQQAKSEQFKHIKILVRHPKLLTQPIELSPKETLIQLKQYLSEATLLYLYDNYHFRRKGTKLQQYAEIQNILEQDDVIDIVLDPFDERTIKHHIRRVREIIKNPIMWSVLNEKQRDPKVLKDNQGNSTRFLQTETIGKPDFESPLFYEPQQPEFKQAYEFMNYVCRNPNNQEKNMSSDLLCLHLKTLQGLQFYISASPKGFVVDDSSEQRCYSCLLDLLFNISPLFKQTFNQNSQKIFLSDFDRLILTSHSYREKRWLERRPKREHRWNNNNLFEEQNGQNNSPIRDWNEMLQSQNNQPTTTVLQRLNKAKLMIKVYNEFVGAALEGAKSLVEGRLAPLNPLDSRQQHIYISNSIFYSIALETPYDYSQEKGSEATPSVSAVNCDLRNLGLLLSLEIKDLHVLHTVLIDYRGHRIIAQCIIPGILSAEQLQCSQYGSIDDGKTIQNNKEFESLMLEICAKLNLDPAVEYMTDKGEKKQIAASYEIKGILGSDRRKYILDLMRLSPRDYNFLGEKYHCCTLRQQLINLYRSNNQSKQFTGVTLNVNLETGADFIRNHATQKQEDLLKSMAAFLKKDCIPQLIRGLATTHRKYLSDSKGVTKIFHKYGVNVRYLGQVLKSPLLQEHLHIKLALERVVFVKATKQLLRMAMRDSSCIYLSRVIARILNSLFGNRLQRTRLLEDDGDLEEKELMSVDELRRKKKKRKNHKVVEEENSRITIDEISLKSCRFLGILPQEVWQEVRKLATCRYQHQLPLNIDDFRVLQLPFSKVASLRDVCLIAGIIIERKNYALFDPSFQELPFQPANILDIQPIVKYVDLPNRETASIIEKADQHLSKFQIDEAIELYNNAIQYMVGLYGGMSDQIAAVHHKIATVYYRMGQFDSAVMCQRSCVDVLQAIYGQDDVQTVESYSNLAIFYFSKLEKDKALHYLYKSIYLSSFAFGQTYPQTIVNRLHLSSVYQECGQSQRAIVTLLDTIDGVMKIYGRDNANTAVCYQALASLHYEINDLRQTIQFQEVAISIFKKVLKQNDGRVIEAVNMLGKYHDLLNNKRMRDDAAFKKASREELMGKPFGRVENGGFQRNVLVNRLQLAKFNSRMGMRR